MLNGYIAYLKKSKQGANEPGVEHHVRDDAAVYADSLETVANIEGTTL